MLLADDLITPLEMTPGVIASRRNGHMLRGMCGASKCDRLLVKWDVHKQQFRYRYEPDELCQGLIFKKDGCTRIG